MKCALASHLRKGKAYRQGVSEKNYESFVRELQSLAKELESIPGFRVIRGSDKEAGQPAARYDQDGDDQMADISSLQSQIQAQTQPILAVLKGTNDKPSSGNVRKNDLRLFPLEISQAERNRRIDSNQC
ncbi:hypothetical protein K3495_g2683 [Podosphaera aphanis]|nr:hypothetical protein K3495_g2683 [Podosphaera aphanis]